MSFYDADNQKQEGALSWDDEISQESSFEVFPDGVYDFIVTNMEREQYEGGDNISACPVAELTFQVRNKETGQEGELSGIRLFLHTKTEWVLSAFFASIGQKKPGEPYKPNWNEVVGSKGAFELESRKYTSKTNGKEYENNQVKKWLKPGEVPQTQTKKEEPQATQTEFKGW